jgi:predicted lipoprotein with Yx(FWY)xxD motif
MTTIMKVRFLPFLAFLACSSSVLAQPPFPLPIPTRPTSFPLPIPTRPTNPGYVIGAPGVTINLPGKVQGNVCKLRGLLAIDTAGKAFSVDGQNFAVGLIPTNVVDGTQTYQSVAAITAAGAVVAAGVAGVTGSNGQYQQVDVADLVPEAAASGIVAIEGTDEGRWMALKQTGEVIAWEAERYAVEYNGMPGGVAVLVPATPVPESARSEVVAISLAGTHYLALKSSGEVIAWGPVAVGTSGPPDMQPPPPIQYDDASTILPPEVSSGVVAIAAGPHNGIAIKEDGTLVQWGRAMNNMSYPPRLSDLSAIPSGLASKQVVSIDADQWSAAVAALTSDGTVHQWGMGVGNMGATINTSLPGKMLVSVYVGWNGPLGLSVSDDESFSDLVGFPLDKLAQLVAQKILAHTNNYGLATKPDLLSAVEQAASQGEAQGIAAVQSQPNTFGLFDSTQYEANRITGVAEGKAEVTTNPTAYNLFTESSIMDMNLGGLMLKKRSNANELDLELTIETKDSLLDNGWQVAERIARKVSMDGVQRQFLRVRADAPYVAPNVKVLAHPTLGNILTDGAGRVLYYFAADSAGGNPLFSGASWPYVSVPEAPKADAGVSATLASSTFGKPGGPYLTVNARPVYTYVGDAGAGQANGHGAGWVWWTIRADGAINQ